MLTQEDLRAIEKIFEKSFEKSFDKSFKKSFDMSFDKKFGPAFDMKSKSIHSKLNKLQKDMNTIVSVFDSEIVDLKDRTKKLEADVFATM